MRLTVLSSAPLFLMASSYLGTCAPLRSGCQGAARPRTATIHKMYRTARNPLSLTAWPGLRKGRSSFASKLFQAESASHEEPKELEERRDHLHRRRCRAGLPRPFRHHPEDAGAQVNGGRPTKLLLGLSGVEHDPVCQPLPATHVRLNLDGNTVTIFNQPEDIRYGMSRTASDVYDAEWPARNGCPIRHVA